MDNDDRTDNLECIRRAQGGDSESQTRLAELTEQTVFPYLYRLTFDFHLAQDLCQETLMEMVRSLARLKLAHEGAYWAWIYRTALSKVQKHHRRSGNQRLRIKGMENMQQLAQQMIDGRPGQVDSLIQEELLGAVLKAMHTLRFGYRNILTLRCLQGLSYAEIAVVLGRSQLAARLQFFKARQALQRKLRHSGFSPSYLVPALTLLAGSTAVNRAGAALAATSVGASVLRVPVTTAWLGWLFSAAGAAVTLMATTVLVFTGASLFGPDAVTPTTLAAQVAAGTFACPSAVLEVGDAHRSGFFRVNATASYRGAETLAPEQMPGLLHIDDPNALRLYREQHIVCSFDGAPLTDGPGPDIYVAVSGCLAFRLFLRQGDQAAVEIAGNACPGWRTHHERHVLAFDLKDVPGDVNTTELELRTTGAIFDSCGLEIQGLCARTGL